MFSGYIRGQFIDAIIVGVLSSTALLIAGVPNAIVVGVLAGLGNLIPYVGPLLGFLTLVLVCIPTAVWGKLLVGAVILIAVMLVDSNLINPRLLSSNIKIHPLRVVAALLGGGALGGIVGMIIAVPIAALLKVQLDRKLDKKEREIQSLSKVKSDLTEKRCEPSDSHLLFPDSRSFSQKRSRYFRILRCCRSAPGCGRRSGPFYTASAFPCRSLR